MLNIPDATSHYVLLSQYAGAETSWRGFECRLNDVFAANKDEIVVVPCRYSGSSAANFCMVPVNSESAAFRNRILSPNKWAVMYINSKDGTVYDYSDAWLSCFEQEFSVVMSGYSKSMMRKRGAAKCRDGAIAKVADGNLCGTSQLLPMLSGVTHQVAIPSQMLRMMGPPSSRLAARQSLRDPADVEGCAGVDAKRDALLRRMFG